MPPGWDLPASRRSTASTASVRSAAAIDEAVETIYGTLRRRGALSNTYIVFTGDNGFHMGEHRFAMTMGFAFEESIRVPLLVRGAGVPAGRKIGRLVGNADTWRRPSPPGPA